MDPKYTTGGNCEQADLVTVDGIIYQGNNTGKMITSDLENHTAKETITRLRNPLLEIPHRRELTVDEILPIVGELGLFQKISTLILCMFCLVYTYPAFIMEFAAISPQWKCVENSTECTRNGTHDTSDAHRCSLPRRSWQYTAERSFSVVVQFDLSCERGFFVELATSITHLGNAIGVCFSGWASDNYGRRPVFFFANSMLIVFTFAMAFASTATALILLRFCVGLFSAMPLFVMVTEVVGHGYRPLVGNLLWLFWCFGMCILSGMAYLIKEWRLLFILTSAPYLVLLLTWRCIPRSVRWLNMKGKSAKAMKVLQRVAKFNGNHIPDSITLRSPCQSAKDNLSKRKTNPTELFTTSRKMAVDTLIQCFGWFTQGLVYYGISYSAGELGGNLYANFMLGSVAEVPAVFFGIWACGNKWLGRKRTVSGSMMGASICCIALNLVPNPDGMDATTDGKQAAWISRVALGSIGKFFIAVSWNCSYVWSVELFPTSLRAQGMGFLEITSLIGAATSPWVAKGLKKVHPLLPFIVMGAFGLVAAVVVLWLDETRGRETLETHTTDTTPETENSTGNPVDAVDTNNHTKDNTNHSHNRIDSESENKSESAVDWNHNRDSVAI